MKTFAYSFTGLVLAATAAHAQPAANVTGAIEGDVTGAVQGPEAPAATLPAQPPLPAEPAAPVPATPAADVSVALSDTEVDSFAKATVKLQQIQADATIGADQKRTAMVAAVTEAGLDAATYNEIGAKVSEDAELRARVQTAMARHSGHSDG